MRRFDKAKNIQKLNEKLNREKNSLNEYHDAFEGGSQESVNLVYNAIKSFTHNNPNAIPDRDYYLSGEGSGVGEFLIEFDELMVAENLAVRISIDREVFDFDDSRLMVNKLEIFEPGSESPIHVELNEKILNKLFPTQFMDTYERTYNEMNAADNSLDEYEEDRNDYDYDQREVNHDSLFKDEETFNRMSESFEKLCGLKLMSESKKATKKK